MESFLGILSCHRKLLFTDNPGTTPFVRSTSNHTLDTIAVANDTDGSHSAATCCPAVLHGPLRMAFSHRDLERQLQSGSKAIRKSVTLLHKPSAIPTQVGCYNLFTCHRKASALL